MKFIVALSIFLSAILVKDALSVAIHDRSDDREFRRCGDNQRQRNGPIQGQGSGQIGVPNRPSGARPQNNPPNWFGRQNGSPIFPRIPVVPPRFAAPGLTPAGIQNNTIPPNQTGISAPIIPQPQPGQVLQPAQPVIRSPFRF